MRPNCFEFVFTPKHGSWLNLVEVFFAKMTKTILRGIRVASKAELKARTMQPLQDLNADPVVFRWRYKLEEETVSTHIFYYIFFYPRPSPSIPVD